MSTTRTAAFTASGTWTCPVGVTAIWLSMVGGGNGTAGGGDPFSFQGGAGGGGSGELVTNRMIPVVPTTVYTVTVGTGSAGTAYDVQPAEANPSSFAGFIALGANGYIDSPFWTVGVAGTGGGVGGSPGGNSGGGFDMKGRAEARNWTGGSSGSYNGSSAFQPSIYGTLGGESGTIGAFVTPPPRYGGGAGGGAIWGGNVGGPGQEDNATPPSTDATHYGAGAGGGGSPISGIGIGADGIDGYVLIMWVE